MSNTSDQEPLDRTFGWVCLSAHHKEGPQCITVKGRKGEKNRKNWWKEWKWKEERKQKME